MSLILAGRHGQLAPQITGDQPLEILGRINVYNALLERLEKHFRTAAFQNTSPKLPSGSASLLICYNLGQLLFSDPREVLVRTLANVNILNTLGCEAVAFMAPADHVGLP